MDKFYNSVYKESFLLKHENKTQDYNFFKRLFLNTKDKEVEMNKDLYDFSKDDIYEVISDMRPSTSASASKIISMIKRYLSHSSADGYKMTNILQINKISSLSKEFVPSNPQFYISENELQIIEDNCVNSQDAFILRAIFEGVRGNEMFELRNLKLEHINFEKKCVLINFPGYGKNREFKVSERFVSLAIKSNNQKAYYLNNGEKLDGNFRRLESEYELQESAYILKKSNIGRVKSNEPITAPTLYKRLNSIKSFQTFTNVDKYYLKFNNIYKSGSIWYSFKLIESKSMDVNNLNSDNLIEIEIETRKNHLDLPLDSKKIINLKNLKDLYVTE